MHVLKGYCRNSLMQLYYVRGLVWDRFKVQLVIDGEDLKVAPNL